MNTFRENTSKKRASKKRPTYASQIRELRTAVALSQPDFGKELNVKRGAIAQWEAGTREPRDRNYRSLAEFATKRNLLWFTEFFRSQALIKQWERSGGARRRHEAAFAERRLSAEKRLAAMGNQGAKRLFGLSEMDRATYRAHFLELINKEISELKTWHFSDVLDKFADEAWLVERLRSAPESIDKLRGHGDGSK